MKPETVALSLLTSEAVRTRAHKLLALGLDGKLLHFQIDLKRLDAASDLVIKTMRAAYPSLDVPLHSRWRHFEFQGIDRWALISRKFGAADEAAHARAAFDLAIISVLLDAGAGPSWRYHDHVSGQTIGRSEGLALASLTMFQNGVFSADPSDPLRADAAFCRICKQNKFGLGCRSRNAIRWSGSMAASPCCIALVEPSAKIRAFSDAKIHRAQADSSTSLSTRPTTARFRRRQFLRSCSLISRASGRRD